jgi:hypothetical protein
MPRDPHSFSPHRRRFMAGGVVAGATLLAACGKDATGDNTGNAAQPATPREFKRGNLGTIIGGGKMASPGGQVQFFVGLVDLDADTPKAQVIENIGFLGHGFSPNPVNPSTAIVCEKHGPGCCEIDLVKRKVLRRIKTVPGREFYGHGAFTPDGKTFYATEANTGDNSYDGVLAVRDGESFELRPEKFPTHGVSPHDCILVDDGDTLVVTNGGGPVDNADEPAGIAYVNVRTGEARRKLKFKDGKINAGHIAITGKGELVCVSAPRDGIPQHKDGAPNPEWRGAITFYDPHKDRLVTADDPIRAKMRGETLSVAIHEPSMVVAATNPSGDLITFWDFHTGKLVHHIEGEFKWPRGISLTLDGNYFAVTYDEQTHLQLIDAETFKPISAPRVETSYISGSHNIAYDL